MDEPGKKTQKSDIEVLISATELNKIQVKPHLTIRVCLSLHSKPYDPMGFILPTKMIGSILFRDTIQFMKRERKGKVPWDDSIENDVIVRKWLDYFEMLLYLDTVKFKRCVKPADALPGVDPDLVTFDDGNPSVFGTVAYALFEVDGTSDDKYAASLLMSKAKLGPLAHIGETYRNELCGATYAARLKQWIIQESEFNFRNHYHFLDSKIVHAMIRKSSYGFNTFAGLRVGEIQMKTNVDDWKHIPSGENIADCLTKGIAPSKLVSGSAWQCGPSWLSKSESACYPCRWT